MIVGIEEAEKIKDIMLTYMKTTNTTAYKLNKNKIISYKTLKKILGDTTSNISVDTISKLNEKIPFNKSEKKVINNILKKYEQHPKKNTIKNNKSYSAILDTVGDVLNLIKETKDIIEEIRNPINTKGNNHPKEDYYLKRKINSFTSDFDNRTLLITKIWELNNGILDKWKEVDLLLGINNVRDNKKIKKALVTISNNLKEIALKIENASFDSDDIPQEEIIIIKGE